MNQTLTTMFYLIIRYDNGTPMVCKNSEYKENGMFPKNEWNLLGIYATETQALKAQDDFIKREPLN